MKIKFLIAGLFLSLVATAQPSNYIKFNTRGRWIAGMFDSTLHLPRFNGTPSLRTGGSSMDGAVAIDTTNSVMYFYSGGEWKRANIDTSAYAVTSLYRKPGTDSVFYTKGGVHTFGFKDSTGGGTPTLQQVLTAGSTLTESNFIDGVEPLIFQVSSGSNSGTLTIDGGVIELSSLKTGGNSFIKVEGDSILNKPHIGNYYIDSLNYTLSTTGKKILIRDTATGLVQNIDPSLIGGGIPAIGTINSETKSANGAVISGSNLVMQTADATYPGLLTSSQYSFIDSVRNGLVADSSYLGLVLGSGTYDSVYAYIKPYGEASWDSSFQYLVVKGPVTLSSIAAATATNTINNGNYKQEWQWDNLSSGYGLDLTSSTTSPASTVGLLNSTIDGANSNAGITSYAIIGQNYKTGTSSTNYGASFTASGGTTNIGARFTAAGGTNNYAITVPSSGGSVGIGTEAPASKLHTVGTVRHATLGTASGDTTTNKPVGINSSGDIIPMTHWPGGGGSTSPAGNNRNIQFNSNGAFAGNDSLKFEGGFLKTSNNVPLQIGGVNVINYDNNTNVTTVGGSAYITTISSGGYTVFGTNSKGAIDHTNGALTLGANIGDSLFTNNGSSHQVGNARFDARVNVAKASGYATNINGSLGANDFATKGYVDSTRSIESTYTPSLTNTTNISASTAYTTHYQRIDDVVHVWGEVDIDATTAATISEMGLSLPTTTDIAQTYDLAGTASFEDNTIVQIKGDVTNNRAMFRFTPVSNTNNKYSFHFTYKHYTP